MSGTVLPDASVARVALSSNPNASIYIDGEPAGRTPATLSLKPGQHDLRLIAKTFEEWTRRIVVTEDGQAVPPGAADGPPRTVVATGESQSIPAELVPQRAIEVLRVIGKDVGKDPFVDAAKMIRVATRTDNFRVADDVNAIAYIQPETHEVRDIAFKLTMRWHRAGGLEPYEQTGEQRISRDWDQTFIRACAPATSLDGRGSGEPLKVELVVDDQILAEFSFTISGGSLADAPPTQCQNTNLPSSQAALPVLLPLASPGWLG
jgi:hypothetical protein